MANKGIIVQDAGAGESIACIDARENDDDGNARIIQQFSEISSPANSIQSCQSGTPLRTLDFANKQGDGIELNSSELDGGITDNLLDVSDASIFVLYFALDYSDEVAELSHIQCVPLAFNDAGTQVAFCFPPSLIRVPYEVPVIVGEGPGEYSYIVEGDIGVDESADLYQDNTNSKFISLPLVYPTYGLKYIGVNLRSASNSSLIVDVFGYTLSGAPADAALSQANFSNKYHSTGAIAGGGALEF